jgi:hypothetical protein
MMQGVRLLLDELACVVPVCESGCWRQFRGLARRMQDRVGMQLLLLA